MNPLFLGLSSEACRELSTQAAKEITGTQRKTTVPKADGNWAVAGTA